LTENAIETRGCK